MHAKFFHYRMYFSKKQTLFQLVEGDESSLQNKKSAKCLRTFGHYFRLNRNISVYSKIVAKSPGTHCT